MSGSRKASAGYLSRFLRPAALGFFLVLEGCASGGSGNPFVESANMDVILLRVESRNTFEVSVYVSPAGKRQLVGTISPSGLEFLEFEYPSGRPLNIELETRVGDRYRLPPLLFTGGGRLDLLVSGELRSSVFVNRSPS